MGFYTTSLRSQLRSLSLRVANENLKHPCQCSRSVSMIVTKTWGLISSPPHFCECELPCSKSSLNPTLISKWLCILPFMTPSFMPLQFFEALSCAIYNSKVLITKFPVSSSISLSISFIVCSKNIFLPLSHLVLPWVSSFQLCSQRD